MTAWSTGCPIKIVYINLSLLLLLNTSIYIFLYSSIGMKSIAMENVNKCTTINIQRCKATRLYNDIEKGYNRSKLLLTLFTSWNTKAEKYLCHNNTIGNWPYFKPLIQPILFTNETTLTEEAVAKGWGVLPIRRSEGGVPILKYMFSDVMEKYDSHFYAFSNGDILYSLSLITTLMAVLDSFRLKNVKPIMMFGRRTNVENVTSEEASSGKNIKKTAKSRGKLFTVDAEDYFITSANYPWMDIPEVIIGRIAYDNWLVWNARILKHITIDATKTLLALHQTTEAGNNEGFKANNSRYNKQLLNRIYHLTSYAAGNTFCAEYTTRYNASGVEIRKRKIRKSCSLSKQMFLTSRHVERFAIGNKQYKKKTYI